MTFAVMASEQENTRTTLENKFVALEKVTEISAHLCGDYMRTGSETEYSVSSGVKAEISGFVKFLANLGIEIGSDVKHTEFESVMREHLAGERKSVRECAIGIWDDLKEYIIYPQGSGFQSSAVTLIATLDARAKDILRKIEFDIRELDQVTFESFQKCQDHAESGEFGNDLIGTPPSTTTDLMSKFPFHPEFSSSPMQTRAEDCLRIMKQEGYVVRELDNIQKEFMTLHAKHILALKDADLALAHEYNRQIQELLYVRYTEVTAQNVGMNPGPYATGFEKTWVDTRAITRFRQTDLFTVYQRGIRDEE